jgi:hypothetical protein
MVPIMTAISNKAMTLKMFFIPLLLYRVLPTWLMPGAGCFYLLAEQRLITMKKL